MRTLASFLMVSLDGYFEAGNPEDFDWHNVDDEFNDFAVEQLDASDCLPFGRVTYQGMAGYWPTPEAIEDDPQVASRMNETSKIVISRTLDRPDPDWNSTRLIMANVREEMSELKEQPGKDLLVLGSSNLTASLMSMDLLDQLRIMVNPIVLGEGHSVLGTTNQRTRLKLLKHRMFRSGTTRGVTHRGCSRAIASGQVTPLLLEQVAVFAGQAAAETPVIAGVRELTGKKLTSPLHPSFERNRAAASVSQEQREIRRVSRTAASKLVPGVDIESSKQEAPGIRSRAGVIDQLD